MSNLKIQLDIKNAKILFDRNREKKEISLHARSLGEVENFISRELQEVGLRATEVAWQPSYDVPAHKVEERKTLFDLDEKALSTLSDLFQNAFLLLKAFESSEKASETRCWPHHFDVGNLILLGEKVNDEQASVGLGFSPGDDTYSLPYFYVSPWPYPAKEKLKSLILGHWHTENFTSAILEISEILESSQQMQEIQKFLFMALESSKSSLTSEERK